MVKPKFSSRCGHLYLKRKEANLIKRVYTTGYLPMYFHLTYAWIQHFFQDFVSSVSPTNLLRCCSLTNSSIWTSFCGRLGGPAAPSSSILPSGFDPPRTGTVAGMACETIEGMLVLDRDEAVDEANHTTMAIFFPRVDDRWLLISMETVQISNLLL